MFTIHEHPRPDGYPYGIPHETTKKLVSCCPFKIKTFYIRRLKSSTRDGYCNHPDCWTWLGFYGESCHQHNNSTSDPKRLACYVCNGKGWTNTIHLTHVYNQAHTHGYSYGSINPKCSTCSGQGFFNLTSPSCKFCHIHCPFKRKKLDS